MDDFSRFEVLAKRGLAGSGLGALGVALGALFFIPGYGLTIALCILLLFLLFFGGYYLYRFLVTRRKRSGFARAIESQVGASPRAISDPNQKARLDSLRQKFQRGLQEYRRRGKDIYTLPWFVIIGEPGSGKTEAIRHSGIEFPPGLQDELQGSGGTVNMDWWFTNRGIILDTAGSMIFQEAKTGESLEWREFLRLLRRARPQCPINGLLLVLSAESLIRDTAEDITRKAGVLAKQLDLIQRTTDVRFPVYLLVTKSDLITGFNEFFVHIDEPELQYQILGWSNPEPLDAPFNADRVPDYLAQVVEPLKRRRAALVTHSYTSGSLGATESRSSSRQAASSFESTRRLDEVDALFALTDAITRLAPRLQRYLATVFGAGEWSAKPVFLRGIYFTSSMREGKALDEALALAAGLSFEDIPEERSWEKNKSLFLRHLFVEKVFKEKGLVTRAANTLQMLRKRQWAVFGGGGAALAVFLIFAWLGYTNLRTSVGDELSYWKVGADTNDWSSAGWGQTVVGPVAEGAPELVYRGRDPVKVSGQKELSLVEFHSRLSDLVSREVSIGWIFRPVAWLAPRGTGSDRLDAQRLLFEASVLHPLLDESRKRMVESAPGEAAEAHRRHHDALIALIQLEAQGPGRAPASPSDPEGAALGPWDFGPLLRYLVPSDSRQIEDDLPELHRVFRTTYSALPIPSWPPSYFLGGNSLAANAPIGMGLTNYLKVVQAKQQEINQSLAQVEAFVDAVTHYHQLEARWFLRTNEWCRELAGSLAAASNHLVKAQLELPTSLGELGPVTNLARLYQGIQGESQATSALAFEGMTLLKGGGVPLLHEVAALAQQFTNQAMQAIEQSIEARQATFEQLDRDVLALTSVGQEPLFALRLSLYHQACSLEREAQAVSTNRLIGGKWNRWSVLSNQVQLLWQGVQAYSGPLEPEVSNVCRRIEHQAGSALKVRFRHGYTEELTNRVAGLQEEADYLTSALGLFTEVSADFSRMDHAEFLYLPGHPTHLRSELQMDATNVLTALPEILLNRVFGRVAFPIVRDSQEDMTAKEIVKLRRVAGRLSGLTNNAVWTQLPAPSRQRLEGNPYAGMITTFLDDHDTVRSYKLYFLASPSPTDKAVVSLFRGAALRIGDAESDPLRWEELSDVSREKELGEGRLDQPFAVLLRRFVDQPGTERDPPPLVAQEPWAVLRLIQRGEAAPLPNDPLRWRIVRKVRDEQAGIEGTLTFEIRLDSALPPRGDWPAAPTRGSL